MEAAQRGQGARQERVSYPSSPLPPVRSCAIARYFIALLFRLNVLHRYSGRCLGCSNSRRRIECWPLRLRRGLQRSDRRDPAAYRFDLISRLARANALLVVEVADRARVQEEAACATKERRGMQFASAERR